MIIIPTLLSLLRIALAPVFIILLWMGATLSALIVFTVAALTDMFDGRLARYYGVTSAWGAFIDPLADKILLSSAFVCFMLKGVIEWWVVVAMLGRDVLVTILRSKALRYGSPLQTTSIAKLKTVGQFITIYLAFIWIWIHGGLVDVSGSAYVLLCIKGAIYVVAGLTAYTGVDYIIQYLRVAKR